MSRLVPTVHAAPTSSVGSASEVEYHLLLARDLGLLSAAAHGQLHQQTTEVKRVLASFLGELRSTADR